MLTWPGAHAEAGKEKKKLSRAKDALHPLANIELGGEGVCGGMHMQTRDATFVPNFAFFLLLRKVA